LGARDFQSAMMDMGALVCTSRRPRCHICSIKKFCAAPDPDLLPVRRNRCAMISLIESHAWIRRQDEILLTQCRTRWRRMWMLPAIMPRQSAPIYELQFPFTHHQVALRVFPIRTRRRKPDENWFSLQQLKRIPIPSPHRRAIEAILERH
jgi:A/G-specific adenine glycosylase